MISDPIDRFGELLERARQTELPEPTAMALATADASGRPSVRMVLLKGFDREGFVFFTNLESRKAGDMAANPRAALCFHWQPLEVQVRVEGSIAPVADAEADAYFDSRPHGSQIGAWASRQSRPLPARQELEERILEFEARFAGAPVPRPAFWSGYRLAPERIEFWSGRPSRLHDREVYHADPAAESGWRVERLYP
jgi:pyridoxamine 5'-phosphate oxidase